MPTARAMSSIWASRTPRSSKSRRVAEMISASRCRRRVAAVPPRPGPVAGDGSELMPASLGRSLGRPGCGSMPACPSPPPVAPSPPPAVSRSSSPPRAGRPLRCRCRRRRAGDGRFAGTARLPNCSASVVRWPAALDTDRAVVLTNGHCVRRPFLGARDVLVDEKRWKRVELLDGRRQGRHEGACGPAPLRLDVPHRPRHLRLRESYADLAGAGVAPLSLAAHGPSRGDRIRIPSGYWTEQRACTTTGTAHRLHERSGTGGTSIRLPGR